MQVKETYYTSKRDLIYVCVMYTIKTISLGENLCQAHGHPFQSQACIFCARQIRAGSGSEYLPTSIQSRRLYAPGHQFCHSTLSTSGGVQTPVMLHYACIGTYARV